MEFDKDFNPGTGNSFNEWNIQHVENLNPNATTVSTTHYHYEGEKPSFSGRKKIDDDQKAAIQEDILAYVGKLTDCVKPEWKTKYATLWDDILAIPQVAASIYNKGQQKGTTFNRDLVGNIINVLKGKVLDGNDTDLTIVLENKPGHSIRGKIGKSPSSEIEEAILKLLVKSN